jgi:hypothetical protein
VSNKNQTPEMQRVTAEAAKAAFEGNTPAKAEATETCVRCSGPATEFKDELSKREYAITRFCQECQDGYFG